MKSVMTIRPPDELRTFLRQYAQSLGLTVNGIVLQILWDWKTAYEHQDDTRIERG